MNHKAINYINDFICWIKKNQLIKPKEEVVKVNIGCGLTVAYGWINIDASLNAFFSKWPNFILKKLYKISGSKKIYSLEDYCSILKNYVFIHHKLEYGIPFPDESIDYLYSSHLLEHLFNKNAKMLLHEAYRVLKKQGYFRLCVPDLEYIISLYKKGQKEESLQYFFPDSKSGCLSSHKYLYDYELLHILLKESGFIKIQRCSYKIGDTPDIEILDNKPEETLYIEAKK
ncbi:MAG: hypothetical protein A2Y62_10800 [Candidatus Fischerbacteria bacterium RBG_13_37_8]|uniref:Methyltransferase type 11 domain-containing protein n=1 Tax=Candidatus Fischerbacteria bacterium RBG_13_37_8 TaxID=1817863 RepID=A0A1F5VUH6_9BACT|nr:MAG: hypothetical protein A2Y62_10800 [Candidatus Fischerbacteria bacterium RBG_13_37_8]